MPDCVIYSTGHGKDNLLLDAFDLDSLAQESSASKPEIHDQINFSDKLFYIFTSGTTG